MSKRTGVLAQRGHLDTDKSTETLQEKKAKIRVEH